MSIDRISPYGGFYDRYKVAEIQRVSVEDVKKQDEQLDKQQGVQRSVVTAQNDITQETFAQAPKTAKLEDISLSFNVNETYGYIGKDADLQKLDITSAISDVQKDKVLEQYQYFVEPKQVADPVVARTMDGMVIRK